MAYWQQSDFWRALYNHTMATIHSATLDDDFNDGYVVFLKKMQEEQDDGTWHCNAADTKTVSLSHADS